MAAEEDDFFSNLLDTTVETLFDVGKTTLSGFAQKELGLAQTGPTAVAAVTPVSKSGVAGVQTNTLLIVGAVVLGLFFVLR